MTLMLGKIWEVEDNIVIVIKVKSHVFAKKSETPVPTVLLFQVLKPHSADTIIFSNSHSRQINPDMRTFRDRVRHTIIFELLALIAVALGGSLVTGHSMEMLGIMSLMFSVLVMAWNMLYNWLFDLWEQRNRNGIKRSVFLRVIHAIIFETVLLFVGVFLVAWWLDLTLLDALILDIGLAVFFVGYAFAYNWIYDIVFPIPNKVEDIS